MGYILSIIALVIFFVVHFINALVVVVLKINARAFLKTTDTFFFNSALELDIYGNYAYRYTWNALLRTKDGYLFGERWETISSALGKNQRDKTLTVIGWIVVGILFVVDPKYWFNGGHSLNSIREESFRESIKTKQ